MEHIRQFDWCYSQPDIYFLKEDDMAHSVTEKILRNKFRNPAISSESDEDGASIDWDEIFTTKQNSQFGKTQRVYVPCLPPFPPPYPKLSAIDGRQQYQCIKVICAENPHILPEEFVPRPTKGDHRVFEELKEKYEKEQKEYIEWAKTMWTTSHCVRALHPKPHVEAVYEAKLKMRAHEMSCYPKTYAMAAQIPLETCGSTCEMVLDQDLKRVNIKSLPQIECRPLTQKLTIIRPCNMPEPCAKHPCKFMLPNEKSVSILPLTEVQRELAQYALDNDAHYVASENALKCLVEHERPWDLGIAVCPTIGPDGETTNIVVLGSEYSVRKEAVLMRTYRAFRYLLQHSLIPPSEKSKLNYKDPDDNTDETSNENDEANSVTDNMAVDSDDDDNSLCIDEDIQNLFESEDDTEQDETHGKNNDKTNDDKQNDEIHSNGDDKGNNESHSNSDNKGNDETHRNGDDKGNDETHSNGDDKGNDETHSNGDDKGNDETHSNSDDKQNNETNNSTGKNTSKSRNSNHMKGDSDDFYSCTCKDTIFERPPPRSFRKWRVKNKTTHETYDVIVHCAHKVRDSNGEVILEPIPEYQLDLGGSAPSKGRIRSLALSLHLRNNASLRIVRVAGDTGEVATSESVSRDELQRRHGDAMEGVTNTLHTALNQLQGLLPGNYLLHHKAGHGKNALLYAAKPPAKATFTLQFDSTKLEEPDESKSLKTPPTLEPVLLPFHKFRKFLPCAFTPHQHMMPREPRRPPQRQKTPPRALQWPKRKRKRKNT